MTPPTHKISIRCDEPLLRGETLTLIVDTATCEVLAVGLITDQRDGIAFADVTVTVEGPPMAELTSQQAADRLGVSRPWLTARLKPHRMVGNRSRYRIEDVDAYGASLEAT